MNPITVLKIMGEMGARYRESKIHEILDYTTRMCDNGRVLVISDSKTPLCVAYFSITNDAEKFLNKGEFEFISHDPDGNIAVLEKLVSTVWNRKVRKALEAELVRRFPTITQATWYRYGRNGDRLVRIKRRLQNV